jgi:16S rRNA (adenine1518-N6/adenine1519-N6)-dimethyltransferase
MTRKASLSSDHFPEFVVKKRLGQNFLVDPGIIQRIADACDLSLEETILEIGPGQGALTRYLLPYVRHVIAIEADRKLAEGLPQALAGAEITVHHGDFLHFDLSKIPAPIKVVGNIPYYISTPIIERVLENRAHFSSIYMTVQLEFGERLVAKVGTRDYSSLTCFVNYFAKPEILFKIAPKAFRPMPRIQSCFMRLVMREKPLVSVKDEDFFLKIIRQGFLQRRKTLVNALGGLVEKEDALRALAACGIKDTVRIEQLDLEAIARFVNELR